MRAPISRRSRAFSPAAARRLRDALALVQAFVNTHFDLGDRFGEEVLHSPAALAEWMRAAGWPLRPGRRRRTFATPSPCAKACAPRPQRASDRAAVATALAGLDALAADARTELRFGPDGPVVTGARGAGLPGATGSLLAIVAEAMRDGSWSRMKVCPGEHCGWLFYDGSRNRSGRWCSMSVCGGRAKARTHYRRRTSGG